MKPIVISPRSKLGRTIARTLSEIDWWRNCTAYERAKQEHIAVEHMIVGDAILYAARRSGWAQPKRAKKRGKR